MVTFVDLADVEGFLPMVVVLLKKVANSMVYNSKALLDSKEDVSSATQVVRIHEALISMNTIIASILYNFKLAHARTILDEELRFWILPRSTAWFSQFLLHKYN
jgi:hypothetical protein